MRELTPEATIEAIAYVIANPVEAGAVRHAKDWPGAHTLPAHVGTRVIQVKCPQYYFDPNNPEWPEELELRLQMPVALQLDYGPEPRSSNLGPVTYDITMTAHGCWWTSNW